MKKHYVPLVILLGVALLFFYSLFIPKISLFSFPDYAQSDLWQQTYPSKFLLADAYKNRILPLWNPFVGMGYPEFAKAEIGALFLPNMLVFSTLPFPIALNMIYVLVFLISSSGMYALLYRYTSRRLPALLGAIVFAYSSFFLTKFPHLSRIESASLVPWIILYVDIFLEKPRFRIAIPLSLLLAQQLYAGHFQIVFMTWLLIGGYAIIDICLRKKIKHVALLIPPLLLSIILMAIQLFPSVELIQNSQRAGGFNAQSALAFSFPWAKMKNFIFPFAGGSPHNGTFGHYSANGGDIFWENSAFIGILALILAALGFITGKKHPKYIHFVLLTLASIFIMTGKYSPLYFIHSILPFSFFRAPSKYIFLFSFSLPFFVSIGIVYLQDKMKGTKLEPYRFVLSLLMGLIIISELFSFYTTYRITDAPDTILNQPKSADYIALHPYQRYMTYGSGSMWNTLLLSDGWRWMNEYEYLQNALVPNLNVIYGMRSFDVYQVLKTRRFDAASHIVDAVMVQKNASQSAVHARDALFSMYAVKALIAPKIPEFYGERHTIQPPTTYKEKKLLPLEVYISPLPVVRYMLVSDYRVVKTAQEFASTLHDMTFDASNSALLERGLPQKLYGTGSIFMKYEDLQSSTFDVDVHGRMLLVLSDSYYPGWKAYIDGKESTILPANINSRAVVIEDGRHKVEFKYQPQSLHRGMYISGFGYLIIILLGVWSLVSEHDPVFSSTSRPRHRS